MRIDPLPRTLDDADTYIDKQSIVYKIAPVELFPIRDTPIAQYMEAVKVNQSKV